MLRKLRNFLFGITEEEKVINTLFKGQNNILNHLVALSRLSMITPQMLAREIQNIQANTEFLVTLTTLLSDTTQSDETAK